MNLIDLIVKRKNVREEEGQTLIEYQAGLLTKLVVVLAAAALLKRRGR